MQWPKEEDRQYNGQKRKTDKTMAKRKRQTIQWPKEKDRQHNGQDGEYHWCMELGNRNESNLHFSVHRDDHLKIKKHGRLF